MEIAQSDAAAAFDWYRSESCRAYERPEDEVTGNKSDDYVRRAPGTAGMKEGVRYQIYETTDGHVLFMASEQEFWKNFCEGVDRMDLFERWPGQQVRRPRPRQPRAPGRARATSSARRRSCQEWLDFGDEHNTPIAPVNTPKTIADDPQFQDRLPWICQDVLGADQLAQPVKIVGGELPRPPRPRPSASTPTRCSARSSASPTPTSRRSATPAPSADPTTRAPPTTQIPHPEPHPDSCAEILAWWNAFPRWLPSGRFAG